MLATLPAVVPRPCRQIHLMDDRVTRLYQLWLAQAQPEYDEYGPLGQFRWWVAQTTQHFVNLHSEWRPEYLTRCYTALGCECPDDADSPSFSEDELICMSCMAAVAKNCGAGVISPQPYAFSTSGPTPSTSPRSSSPET